MMNGKDDSIEMKTETLIKTWDELDLKEDLLRGIFAYGFENPSDIQKKAILPMIQGRHLIAQAQSGSGKTGSFSIGALQLLDVSSHQTQVLILENTHELAKQTAKVLEDIGNHMDQLCIKTLIGGTSTREDLDFFKAKTPHVVVGTVGRVVDMFQKGALRADHLKTIILDEADEILSSGFNEKIHLLFQRYFLSTSQIVLFSATMPPEILSLSHEFMKNPVSILVKKEDLNLKCIQQFFVAVKNDNMKYDVIKDLFSLISVSKCIIYCNNVKRVVLLHESMIRDGFSVCCIHSEMDKTERNTSYQQFRYGDTRVLISSDITARGIDIQQVSTVINFDITRNVNTYLHRIGRSGRWGRKGFAINLVTQMDIPDMKNIENHYGIEINALPDNFTGQI